MEILERKDAPRVICDPLLAEVIREGHKDVYAYCLCTTSGSTGKGLMLAVAAGRLAPDWVGDSRRRLTCVGTRSIRLRYLVIMRSNPACNRSASLALDYDDFTPELPRLLSEFAPDHIRGLISFAIKLSSNVPEDVRRGVSTMDVAGEVMTEPRVKLLRESFPFARIRTMYNVTELFLPVSLPSCGHTPLNQYHPAKDVTIEIREPDEHGYGDLLVTRHLPQGVTIERYRTGDIVRMCGPCPCGEAITFEIVGRRGFDYLKIAGTILRREEFDRVLSLEPGMADDYRAEASEELVDGRITGKIVLRVFRADGVSDPQLGAHIAELVSQNLFLTPTRTLGELVSEKNFLPLVVEFVSEPFPAKFKEVKVMQRT